MSFSSMYAGKQADLVAALAQDPHPNFQYGGDLGKLTQDYLAAVAALVNPARSVIVEASGHADDYSLSLTVRVVTVHHPVPVPAAAEEASDVTEDKPAAGTSTWTAHEGLAGVETAHAAGYVSELPDAATHHPEAKADTSPLYANPAPF